MSQEGEKPWQAQSNTFLLVPIALMFALLAVAVVRGPNIISNVGLASALIVVSPLMLATFALTVIATAGRGSVDLSIGPLVGFINVTMIQLFAGGYISSPFGFFAYAIFVGMAYQLLMGLIIIYVRVQPIIVALSGFLTLSGLNLLILPRPGGTAPEWMLSWGLGETVWSPILSILVVAVVGWFLFARTAFFDHLRLMGSDERTAYTAGVNITIVRLGAHLIGGIYAALAALTFTSLISSGDPSQGSTYTLMAVTALVLGGTSLAGGRGTIIGSTLGAVNIYLITFVLATFNFGGVQSFVTDLAYGIILVVALLLTVVIPKIQSRIRMVSPLTIFVILALIATGVVLFSKDEVVTADAGLGQGLTSLSAQGGQSLSGLSASAETPAPAPTGTPIVITAVIIAGGLFLIFLLYRFFSMPTVLLVAVIALLVLGYGVYDPGTGTQAASMAMQNYQPPKIFGVADPSVLAMSGAATLFSSPWLVSALIAAGIVVFGSVLIFSAVPKSNTKIGNTGLLFLVVGGTVIAGLIVYYSTGHSPFQDNALAGAFVAIIIGALLFFVTLPGFQSRIKNISVVMLVLLSLVSLGSMFFAGGVENAQGLDPSVSSQTITTDSTQIAQTATELPHLSTGYFAQVFWVLLAAVFLYLVTIAPVRKHLFRNIVLAQSLQNFSYTGLFISVFAAAMLGAVFYVGNVPMWKYLVAVVALLVASRFGWRLLAGLPTVGRRGRQ
tara:strand:- start:9993 stop:12170 length:2178 start_codon:yes stop_codon:yes gene_type:complete